MILLLIFEILNINSKINVKLKKTNHFGTLTWDSTMIIKRKIADGIKFLDMKICEDYYFKCKILRKVKTAYCLRECLTKYRIRQNSLQSNKIKNIYAIWRINKLFNKLNFLENLISVISISYNSLSKYGLR